MFKKILLIVFILIITSCHKNNPVSSTGNTQQSTENKWIQKTSMPTARGYFCGAEVNGKIYLFGGIKDLSGHNSDDVEAYDPSTDTWTTKNKMPVKIFGQAAVELNGKIYVIGGRTGDLFGGTSLKYNYLYDPDTDSWTKKTDMPTSRAFISVSAVNGNIYAIGGSMSGYSGTYVVQMYNPVSDTWTAKKSLQANRALLTSNVYNGKIYVIGGGDGQKADAGTSCAYFDVYDPETDTWSSKADIAISRWGHGSGVINDKLYICGGVTAISGSGTLLYDLYEYDINNDKWTNRASMPYHRRCFVTCTYNNKLFVLGGLTGNQGAQQILNNVLEYTPSSK